MHRLVTPQTLTFLFKRARHLLLYVIALLLGSFIWKKFFPLAVPSRALFRSGASVSSRCTKHTQTLFEVASSVRQSHYHYFSSSSSWKRRGQEQQPLKEPGIWSSPGSCMFEVITPHDSLRSKTHWRDKRGQAFKNPWPSYNPQAGTKWEILKRLLFHPRQIPVPANIHEIYRVVKPVWSSFTEDTVRATWMGHATFVVELPKQHASASRGIRILFDPVFSEYTAPALAVKFGLGPRRYSKLPCTVDDLPEIDVICLSHNHYDHLDLDTVRSLEARTHGTMQYICGLNNRRHFTKFGVSGDRVHEMDWGEEVRVTVESLKQEFRMHCCPAQHTSARSLFDTDHSLWCSWLLATTATSMSASKKVYFLGDTGYRYTLTDDRANWPTCPVFREIGEKFGGIDLAMIPIGLYSPRNLLSNVHLCPEDSVDVHVDIKSRQSIGMHFGTFRGGISRNYEDVQEPPQRLAKALDRLGIPQSAFTTLDIGGSISI